MNLYVLLAQRKQNYAGEYQVEALACISEAGQEENPEYLQAQLANYSSTREFDAIAVVKLELRGSDIRHALYPASKAIQANVINEEPLL